MNAFVLSMPIHPTTTAAQVKYRSAVTDFAPVVLRITRGYRVKNVRIFGSFARGEQKKTSDIDLLVDLPDDMGLLDLSGLRLELEEALKRKVDVVSARSIKPALRDRIFAEAFAL